MNKLLAEFGKDNITYGERGAFHEIPLDKWRIDKYEEEEHFVKVKTGFLPHQVNQLREKVNKNKAFNYEDVNKVSNLLFELSIKLKLKEKTDS